MNITEFFIGLEFRTSEGCRWRCTDVGTRTILAIEINSPMGPSHSDPAWFKGPPYVVEEVIFEEEDIRAAFTSPETMLFERIINGSGHPGFSMEAVNLMMEDRYEGSTDAYPNARLLKYERANQEDVWHPFAAQTDSTGQWQVRAYGLFTKTDQLFSETDFVRLPVVSEKDFKRLHARHPNYSASA